MAPNKETLVDDGEGCFVFTMRLLRATFLCALSRNVWRSLHTAPSKFIVCPSDLCLFLSGTSFNFWTKNEVGMWLRRRKRRRHARLSAL